MKFKYVRPHGASVGMKKIINPTTVLAGLVVLGLLAGEGRDGVDSYEKVRGKVEIKTADDLAAAVKVLDEWVDGYAGRTRKGFECVIQEAGKKGCGSIVPDLDVITFCPYCGEKEDVAPEETEPVVEEAHGAEKVEEPVQEPAPAEVVEPLPETPAPAPEKGKGKAKAKGKKDVPKPAPAPAPAPAPETPAPAPPPDVPAKVKGGRVDVMKALASEAGLTVTDRANYISIWNGKDKVCTAFASQGSVCFIVPRSAFDALPQDVRGAAVYRDDADRKAKHLGRDSVQTSSTDKAVLGALLKAASDNAGKDLNA